jgi:2OG-Fe(II) oxygenase superfamily
MDSWFPIAANPEQPPEPHCILYTRNPQSNERVFLTKPWLTEWLGGVSMPEFLKAQQNQQIGDDNSLFLRKDDANKFALIEDRPAWDNGSLPDGTTAEDIAPIRGSLVVFDSVTVPHQVELIKKGNRVALAGWFHEETQPFPEGIYS